MSTLERLSDARGTVEGKIVAIVLAVLLVMPVVGVTAFADSEADHDHGTPASDVVETSVVEELPDTGNQPISEVAEPEQPAAPAVVPEEEPAKEPADADEVRLGLDVDEGAALVHDGKAYGAADGHFVVPVGQDATFTVRLDEGAALADDEPVVLEAADGTTDELVAVDDVYTIRADQLAEGLTVVVAVAGASEPVTLAEEDAWEYPATTQTISAKAWCTSESLGNQSFNTDGNALGSEAGMSLDELASPFASKDGKQYFFHHAQLPTKAMQQLSQKEIDDAGGRDKVTFEEYDPAKAITALRYNESAGSWQYKANGAWQSFDVNEHQLVLYYNQELNISMGEGNVVISAKDWPWTEAEWVAGQSTGGNPGCVIYQVYSATGELVGEQFRTYYYSTNAVKEGISVRVGEYWDVDEVLVRPMNETVIQKGRPCIWVSSPNTFEDLRRESTPDGGIYDYSPDGNDITIPFVASGDPATIWMVGVKVKAAPSAQTLEVEYRDNDTKQLIEGIEPLSVVAKKPSAEGDPSWTDYVQLADGKLVDDPDSVAVATDISSDATMTIPFIISSPNYASRHVYAELEGNTLKLYFEKKYGVTYEWSGLNLDGISEVRDADGQKVADLPHDDGKYLVDDKYQVSAVHKADGLAYAIKDGKVVAVYRFSGWKLDGEVVDGAQDMVKGGVTLVGTWEALTADYKGTVSVEGQVYDGTSDYTDTLKTTLTDPTDPTGSSEPSRYIYKDKEGNELPGAPVDAGDYTVTAVWDATGTRPEVVSDPCKFTISKRSVVLESASDTKVFDGQPLTKKELVEVEQPENGGFVEGQGVDITYTKEITNPGTVDNEFDYDTWDGTNRDNYAISTVFGTLVVTDRDAESKIKVTLVAASEDGLTYDGTEQSVTGLASVDAVMGDDSYVGSEQEGMAVITINGATFKVSGYKTGAAATDAGKWNHNIIVEEDGFIVLDADGNEVTDQFAIETVAGTLEIGQRPVTLTSESATKYYDGEPLTKPVVTVSDDVFAQEANAWAVGSALNVADGKVENSINMAAKADAAEGVNAFNQANYKIAYSCGTLEVLPQSIDPDDSTTPVDPEDPDKPVDPSNPFDPTDPDNPYKGAKVGNLLDRVYNGKADAQAPVVTDINGMPLNLNADYTLVADRDDRTNVRTVTIAVTGTGNYTGTVTRTYDITPAPVKVIVDNAAKKFGEDDPTFTGTIEGLFANDRNGYAVDELGTIAYSRTNSDEAVGAYADVLTAKVTDLNPNYQEPEVVLGTFTITDADAAAISATGVTKTFDGQPASIGASTEDGWTLQYSVDGVNWTTENPSFIDAGTYTVYVKATRPGHADAGPVSASVVVNRAPVTIRVADASKVAGTDDPAFRGTIEGEVAGYPLSGVTYFRSNDDEGVGVYVDVLTATYDDNPNYAVTIDPGTFTITAMALPDNPPTPGPIDTIIDFLSTPIIGGTPGTDGPMVNIADDGTPLANIDDNDTPLAAFDHPLCWVHYYILLGIIITAIYGGGVIARRLNYNRKVKGYEDDVTGKSRDGEEAKRPVAVPTQA